MHITGLILVIFGAVIVFAAVIALSCINSNKDVSTAEAFDIFILGGLITFFRDFFRAIAGGIKNRSSAVFPLVILLGSGIGLIVIGYLLM